MASSTVILDDNELQLYIRIKRADKDFAWPEDFEAMEVQSLAIDLAFDKSTYEHLGLFENQSQAMDAPGGLFRPFLRSPSTVSTFESPVVTPSSSQETTINDSDSITPKAKRQLVHSPSTTPVAKRPRRAPFTVLRLADAPIVSVPDKIDTITSQQLINAGATAMLNYLEADILRSASVLDIHLGYKCSKEEYSQAYKTARLLRLKAAITKKEQELHKIYNERREKVKTALELKLGSTRQGRWLALLKSHMEEKAEESSKLWLQMEELDSEPSEAESTVSKTENEMKGEKDGKGKRQEASKGLKDLLDSDSIDGVSS